MSTHNISDQYKKEITQIYPKYNNVYSYGICLLGTQ